MENLYRLAELLQQRNLIDYQIAKLIGRPAEKQHLAEYIAAAILDIELHPSANHKGSDGRFRQGELIGRTVEIKYCTENKRQINLRRPMSLL